MNASFEARRRRAVRRATLLALSLGTTLGISLGLVATAPAFAQQQPAAWPARPISLVVPFPAGGTTDVLARALADKLSQSLGQPVVVESKPGAGATLGADYVAKAKPDGYTLLMGAVHHTIATSVYKKLPYDFQKDLAPITVVAMVPNVLVVNAALTPAKNVAELVALAKAAPDKLAYGSNGNGTAQHLIGTQFQASTGTTLLHVPYKGSGPLTTDLLGGQVAMSFDTITPVLQHIKGGKLRALAVTTARRSSVLPDVPTLEEAGLKGFDIGTWFGVLAPAATPKEVVARLNAEMVKIIRSPDFAQRMQAIGAEPLGGTPEEMARQIRDETARFAKLVKDGGVAIE
ncbi:Bug family tripartite tricarboxylate transporter substrate binding protein [Variovorax sp. RCC_210]|uniref:Bug family tripartite tricarboxylate transporter substrate binding protein n=1 Tax=Variovorax sp. RCC_210 TaxID=3239217 RepID=UPI00352320B7